MSTSASAPAAVRRAGFARLAGAHAAPSRPRHWPRRLLVAAVAVLLAGGLLFVTAGAHRIDPAAPPAGSATATGAVATSTAAALGGGPVATAVAALVAPGGSDLAAAVPPGFAEFRGYTPVPERFSDGTVRMTHPDGTCSVPGGGTRFGFHAACRAHDYGYDLLRYARASGAELPGDARMRIDGMFVGDLHARCEATRDGLPELGCRVTAEAWAAGVGLNTWREGYGAPGSGPPPLWPLAFLAPAAAVPLIARSRRPRAGYRKYPEGMSTTPRRDEPDAVWATQPTRADPEATPGAHRPTPEPAR